MERGRTRIGTAGLALLFASAPALTGCIPASDISAHAAPAHAQVAQRSAPPAAAPVVHRAAAQPARPAPRFTPTPGPSQATVEARRALENRIAALARGFDGDVGIAVREVETNWTTSWNGQRYFPQQSVSKFWVALNAFARVDAGELDLSQQVTVRREDLTLFHQPIANQVGANGYTTTLDNLLFRALTQSDNTANDFVLHRAGGPEAVRATIARNRLEGVRFGPGERAMQSQIAGLEWRPQYSVGRAFYTARANVSPERRRESFNSYVADPIDGATPEGLVTGLARLRRGELLSERSTERMLSIMAQTRTGPQRLTGGLAPGWRIAHKTGTGQVLGSTQAGYNDIGIVTSPDGRHYAVAVMIGRTAAPIPTRMQLMQNVTRAVVAYHEALRASGGSYAR